MESGRFAFAMDRDNDSLLRIVNKALAAISTNEQMNILRRWGQTRCLSPAPSPCN